MIEINPKVQKIAIGTTQFGMNYGISNKKFLIFEKFLSKLLTDEFSINIDEK